MLQNLVRDAILGAFPDLTERDCTSTTMGESGEDVKLSQKAFDIFPYSVECKSLKRVAIYRFYEQREAPKEGQTLVVIKENGKAPLAVVDFKHFMEIIKRGHQARD